MSIAVMEGPQETTDLFDRAVIHEGRLARVLSASGDRLTLSSRQDGLTVSLADVVLVPMLGAQVSLSVDAGSVVGRWIQVTENFSAKGEPTFTAWVLEGLQVMQYSVTPHQVEARSVVTGNGTVDAESLVLLRAIQTAAQAHQDTRAAHEQWIADLVERAHREADDREWCGDFDDLMADLGLPRREGDYEVDATFEVQARFTVRATSAEAAEEMVRDGLNENLYEPLRYLRELDTMPSASINNITNVESAY